MHVEAAIDVDGLGGDEARHIAAQEHDHVGHLLGPAQPVHGRRLQQLTPHPRGRRMCRHVEMHDAAARVRDEKKTYNVLKVNVCTVKKSQAQSCGRWLARKVRQDWDGGRRSAFRR